MRVRMPWLYLILVAAAILLVLIFYDRPWDRQDTVAALIMIPSGLLWILARIQLGEAFALRPQAKALVTSGLYSKIRHPIYIFSTLALLGVAIMFNKFYLYLLWILILAVEVMRARKEEWILSEKFGQTYLDYKKQTWF